MYVAYHAEVLLYGVGTAQALYRVNLLPLIRSTKSEGSPHEDVEAQDASAEESEKRYMFIAV